MRNWRVGVWGADVPYVCLSAVDMCDDDEEGMRK